NSQTPNGNQHVEEPTAEKSIKPSHRKSQVPGAKSRVQNPGLDSHFTARNPQSGELIGRESELTRLHTLLDQVQAGERRTVFLTGEPGIGKTTVVDAF